MNNHSTRALISLVAVFSNTVFAVAQSPQVTTNFPPITFAETLRSHGITDLSEESLAGQLENSDPEIRSLVASKLAEDHHEDAIPAIESALSRERNLNTQVGLAEALWVLHDDKGVTHLHSMCTNSSLPIETAISVLRALRLANSSGGICAKAFLTAISNAKIGGEVAMAAYQLPSIYRDAPLEEGNRIISVLQQLLADTNQEASVRMASSQALAEIDAPQSAVLIRQAILRETDPNVRAYFEANLKTLEKSQR